MTQKLLSLTRGDSDRYDIQVSTDLKRGTGVGQLTFEVLFEDDELFVRFGRTDERGAWSEWTHARFDELYRPLIAAGLIREEDVDGNRARREWPFIVHSGRSVWLRLPARLGHHSINETSFGSVFNEIYGGQLEWKTVRRI